MIQSQAKYFLYTKDTKFANYLKIRIINIKEDWKILEGYNE